MAEPAFRAIDATVPGFTGGFSFSAGDYRGSRYCRIIKRGDADCRLTLAAPAYEAPKRCAGAFSGVGMGIFLSAEFISSGRRWRSPASRSG